MPTFFGGKNRQEPACLPKFFGLQNLEWARKSMEILTSYVLISAGNYAGFTYFFSIFCWKSIDLKAFRAFGRISFRRLVFSF